MLKNQLTTLPAGSPSRQAAARAAQSEVLSALPGAAPRNVRHFSVGNAFAATLTPTQVTYLTNQNGVASVVPDSRIPTTPPGSAVHRSTTTSKHVAARSVTPSNALCPPDPSKPLLEPEALTAIDASTASGRGGAQQIATGRGVKVAVIAEGLDPGAADYRRADGRSAIVDYQDFSGEGTTGEYGPEIFGDASSIAAQGRVVHDLSDYVSTAHPLPAGCNVVVRGVAPDASIVALKVLGDDGSTYAIASNVLQAIDYAVSTAHVDVINESLGVSGYPDSGSRDAIQLFNHQAIAAGVSVTVATGDAGSTNTIDSPGADPLVISAGATTTERLANQVGAIGTALSDGRWRNGQIAAFSSGGFTQSGTVPTLVAPGDAGWAVCSDDLTHSQCLNAKGDPSSIFAFGGASQAAPLTAGVIALVIQAYRHTHHGASPTPALVKTLLTSTATDLGAPSDEQGAGQLNALAAVRAAIGARAPRGESSEQQANGDGVLASVDQLTDVANPGARETDHVTYTNVGATTRSLNPTVRTLAPYGAPTRLTATLTTDSPTMNDPYGVANQYTVTHFTVRPGTDRATIALAYPASNPIPGLPVLPITSGAPQVTATLIDPSGAYIVSSRPQGGGNSGDFGNVAVARPRPGQWTMILSTKPGYDDFFGLHLETAPYAGEVFVAVSAQHWITSGTVSPAHLALAAGQHRTITIHTVMPRNGGDTSLTIDLAVSGQSATIPLTRRVLIPFTSGVGQYLGTLSGGNGRAGSAAQTVTYAFDVTGQRRDLDVDTHIDFPGQGSLIDAVLIDPQEQTHTVSNLKPDWSLTDLSYYADLINVVAHPTPGRWRLVLVLNSPVAGDSLSDHFTGRIRFDRQHADISAVPSSSKTVWRSGSVHTVNVRYRNNAAAPMRLIIDPRTTRHTNVDLGQQDATLPLTLFPFLTLKDYLVPPMTTSLIATTDATQPALTQISAPTSNIFLAGPNVTGPIAPLKNGHSRSSATVTVQRGSLSIGEWNVAPGQAGPFGADVAPAGTAVIDATARTNGFAHDVTTPTGDPYLPPAESTNAAPVTPVTVEPGQAITIPVTFTVTASPGTTVRGALNVVSPGNSSLLNKVIYVGVGTTGEVLDTIPFSYRVST